MMNPPAARTRRPAGQRNARRTRRGEGRRPPQRRAVRFFYKSPLRSSSVCAPERRGYRGTYKLAMGKRTISQGVCTK